MGSHFSLAAYCTAQVAIDFEPLYYMIAGAYPWHRHLHTFIGALLLATATISLFSFIAQPLTRFWNFGVTLLRLKPLVEVLPCSFCSWMTGSFVGYLSHIVLDALIHSDMTPLWPWSRSNPFFDVVGPSLLHFICLMTFIGGAYFLGRQK